MPLLDLGRLSVWVAAPLLLMLLLQVLAKEHCPPISLFRALAEPFTVLPGTALCRTVAFSVLVTTIGGADLLACRGPPPPASPSPSALLVPPVALGLPSVAGSLAQAAPPLVVAP